MTMNGNISSPFVGVLLINTYPFVLVDHQEDKVWMIFYGEIRISAILRANRKLLHGSLR